MLFQLHEWDIHIVCRGADDASGAGGAAALDPPRHAASAVITARVAGRERLPGSSLRVVFLPVEQQHVIAQQDQ
jgi:hypothetical protein